MMHRLIGGDPVAIRACAGCADKDRFDPNRRRRGDDQHLTGKGRHGTTARILHGTGA